MVELHSGDSGLEELRGVPEAGGFVHVLVEPLAAGGQVEALAEEEELGVESCEEGEDLVEEVKGHEVGGEEGGVEVVELLGEEVVEAMEGGGGAHLRTEQRTEEEEEEERESFIREIERGRKGEDK